MSPSSITAARGPRLAAAVVFVAGCALGGMALVKGLGLMVAAFPTEALLAAVVLAVVSAVGVAVLLRLRPVRPPDGASAAAAVMWGGVAATGCALIANDALSGIWSKSGGTAFAAQWGAALTAPVNEEAVKTAGVVLIAVALPSALRGPVDGLFLGALTGLGFQTVENGIYALNAVMEGGATAGASSVVQSLVLRVGVTGLGTHWAMTAIAGAGVGLLAAARWHPNARRAWAAALAVAAAVALHGFFDAPVLNGTLVGLGAKTAVVFVSVAAVYTVARRSYVRKVRGALVVEGERVGLQRADAVALSTRRGRRNALRRVPAPDRPAAAERQRGILAAAELRAMGGRPEEEEYGSREDGTPAEGAAPSPGADPG
ncbi:PrsW family intramembrane metalloprotease [Nocardiopsis sp. RSe5-2]|uniref:PrsW family intramembrane metalloprotease n=1 Tax=Nocardiopsis endophytica TaxID=3018445 RepID=A0ABT4U8Z3_9ACTN|nr:PrsW family intramembrane metalloprotease [Nocardiopsis endophytica]MDA2812929.1 PrsW family intramembrane metalloprotease [Nocardiopsis endophytica]